VFACASRYLFSKYPTLHWEVLSKQWSSIPDEARTKLAAVLWSLDVVYRGLAVAAVVWCIWSWLKEPFVAAMIASVFAGYAVMGAIVMM
jgi:hypothetical protein